MKCIDYGIQEYLSFFFISLLSHLNFASEPLTWKNIYLNVHILFRLAYAAMFK